MIAIALTESNEVLLGQNMELSDVITAADFQGPEDGIVQVLILEDAMLLALKEKAQVQDMVWVACKWEGASARVYLGEGLQILSVTWKDGIDEARKECSNWGGSPINFSPATIASFIHWNEGS
jgi:hypothetical protein